MEDLEDLRARALDGAHWSQRNLAVKAIAKSSNAPRAKAILLEVISDRRPALWWRRWLGDPFFQVGFTRRNAWQSLAQFPLGWEEIQPFLPMGLDDPYYEVRTATWALLAKVLPQDGVSTEVREGLKERIIEEDNFEILTSALGALDRICSIESLLEWAERVDRFKHWKVRAAYLEAMERCCKRGDLEPERVSALLRRFNMRSEYFRPVFMLKEHGSRLEKSLKVEA